MLAWEFCIPAGKDYHFLRQEGANPGRWPYQDDRSHVLRRAPQLLVLAETEAAIDVDVLMRASELNHQQLVVPSGRYERTDFLQKMNFEA